MKSTFENNGFNKDELIECLEGSIEQDEAKYFDVGEGTLDTGEKVFLIKARTCSRCKGFNVAPIERPEGDGTDTECLEKDCGHITHEDNLK